MRWSTRSVFDLANTHKIVVLRFEYDISRSREEICLLVHYICMRQMMFYVLQVSLIEPKQTHHGSCYTHKQHGPSAIYTSAHLLIN